MNDILAILIFVLVALSPVFYHYYLFKKEEKEEAQRLLRKLKKLLIYTGAGLVLVFVIFLVLNRINFLNYKSPMPYSDYDKITFADFKGFEFFKKTLYGSKQFAYIVTTIETEIGDNEVEVQAYFHPARSFVYNEHTRSKELLKHELYHFKITEIYARRIKKRIKELEHPGKNEIEKIIEQEKIKERSYQKMYDDDTYHSFVFQQQKKYEKEIDSLLSLYAEYKQPKIKLK